MLPKEAEIPGEGFIIADEDRETYGESCRHTFIQGIPHARTDPVVSSIGRIIHVNPEESTPILRDAVPAFPEGETLEEVSADPGDVHGEIVMRDGGIRRRFLGEGNTLKVCETHFLGASM